MIYTPHALHPGAAKERDEILRERRAVLSRGVTLAAAGAVAATTAGALGALTPATAASSIGGTYGVVFASSTARSAWFNNLEGRPMRADDFPATGLAAQGRIPELASFDATARGFIVAFMDADKVAPTMRGLAPYGQGVFAAFNANCKHFHCVAQWRSEEEGESLVRLEADLGHDFVVCGCHGSAYDLYDSGKVVHPPAPRPLDQLRLAIAADGRIQILFENYRYDRAQPL